MICIKMRYVNEQQYEHHVITQVELNIIYFTYSIAMFKPRDLYVKKYFFLKKSFIHTTSFLSYERYQKVMLVCRYDYIIYYVLGLTCFLKLSF